MIKAMVDAPVVRVSGYQALQGDAKWVDSIVELMNAVDESIPDPVRDKDKPFLMPVEDVFTITGRGTVVTGRIERGVLNVNEEVEIVGLKEGPAPKTTVTLYSRLDVYQQSASSPNKTWLQSDGKPHVIMLGDTDTCAFDGDALPISPPPIPPVNLDPPPPPPGGSTICICIPGHPCQPIGCSPGH